MILESFDSTGGSLTFPTGQQPLASKIGSWSRTLSIVPTGDIAAVVFATELPSQLRSRGIDLDRISQIRSRQDGKTLDKTSNTKYAAQPIAEHIQGWLPTRPTDSDSQHEITSLRNQIAELRQRLGDEPAEVSTPPRTGQQSPSSQSTPIQRSLMRNSAPSPPLTIPTTSNSWLTENMPYTGLADRTYAKWLKDLPLSDVQRNVLTTNIPRQKHGGLSIQLKHLKQFRKLL